MAELSKADDDAATNYSDGSQLLELLFRTAVSGKRMWTAPCLTNAK